MFLIATDYDKRWYFGKMYSFNIRRVREMELVKA